MTYIDTGKATVPMCENPQHIAMSRHSGWLCVCGNWHPYPKPDESKERK